LGATFSVIILGFTNHLELWIFNFEFRKAFVGR